MTNAIQLEVRRPAGALLSALVLAIVVLLTAAGPASAAAPKVTTGLRSSGGVALTFDDGWSRSACASIADTLRRANAKATFFINGVHLLQAPYRWRRILEGFQVGNHSLSHLDLVKEPSSVIVRQIRYNEFVHEAVLRRPMLKVFRPPYGSQDARLRGIAASLGYQRTVLWNADTLDWTRSATTSSVIARAIGRQPGSIILMHCGPRVTPRAVSTIIRHYKARGIKLLGLRQVLGL